MPDFAADPFRQERDRILVVDPQPMSFIVSILELEGYRVRAVETAEMALVQLYAQPIQLVVDHSILLRTGQPLSQHIRRLDRLPYIPILLIADRDSTNLVQGLDSGADDFLRQPIEVDELLARVRSLLRMKQSIDSREQILQVREEFLSRLTHDLRTPLVAADRMFARLTQGKYGALNEKTLQVLSSMQANNQDLLQMTNRLLELYRYEAGSKTLAFTTFSLKALLQSLHQELLPLAEAKGLQLSLELDSELGERGRSPGEDWLLQAAKLEIRRMLTNLISNAINFTDQGSVEIQAKRVVGDRYVLRIQDSGCGIPAGDLPQIFNRFYQGQSGRSGYGLGLNLVQQIVAAHQGQISVQSQLGSGSCFEVWLPMVGRDRPLSPGLSGPNPIDALG